MRKGTRFIERRGHWFNPGLFHLKSVLRPQLQEKLKKMKAAALCQEHSLSICKMIGGFMQWVQWRCLRAWRV